MVSVSVIVVALILEAGILKYVNDANAYKLSKVLLDRVFTVLDKNDQSEEELIESLKDDYINPRQGSVIYRRCKATGRK